MQYYQIKKLSPNILDWTEQAIFCYERGCRCEGCYMREILECECQMKAAVFEIVRLHGAPIKKQELDIKEIVKLILDGYNLKQIAEKLDVTYNKLKLFTRANGINGQLIKGGGEMSKRYLMKLRRKFEV